MILVAGPYRSGTGDDHEKMAANVRAMEACALPLFRAGHVPVVGEWLALPLVALAGSRRVGDAAFEEIFHPIAERLLARCDAVLRVGGPSAGADLMVRVASERGLKVFRRLSEVPGCESASEPAGPAVSRVKGVSATEVECVVPILRVRSLAASVEHYVSVLGFTVDWQAADDMASVSRDGHGIMLCQGAQGNPGTWAWIGVGDADRLHEEYAAKRATIRMPPTDQPWAREMQVEDPDGHVLRFGSEPRTARP